MSCDTEVLKPWNQCALTSIEKVIASKRIGPLKVYVFKDSYDQHRIVLKHINKDMHVAGILFDQHKTESHSHIMPGYDATYKRELFAFIRNTVSRRFKLA